MHRRPPRVVRLTTLLALALSTGTIAPLSAQENAGAPSVALAKRLPGLEAHMSEHELDAMRTNGAQVTAHQCGCYDRPKPHFPYTLVIVKTSQREWVARPEGQESAAGLVPIALREGAKYCDLDAEQPCFGEFASPCEFTDARYGAVLVDYFPTCKTAGD